MQQDDRKTTAPAEGPCEEAIEERVGGLAEDVGVEIAKAWTDRQTSDEALVRIDEILGEAAHAPEAEFGDMEPEEAERLLKQVKDWRPAARSAKDRPPLPNDLQGPKGDPAEGKR